MKLSIAVFLTVRLICLVNGSSEEMDNPEILLFSLVQLAAKGY